MNVFCCQLDIVWENKAANQAKVKALLAGTAVPAGSLIVLPEMFSTGFSMQVAAIQEDAPSETESFLSNLAREYQSHVVGGVVRDGRDGRGRNEAVAFDPQGKLVARYCKIHPFTFGGEAEHYEAGQNVVSFNWNDFVVAPFVCYDLRFPEIFRVAVQDGANLLIVIANWPTKRLSHWLALLQARAIENQSYVIGVNRCGNDPKLPYPGRSLVVDPKGEIVADAGETETALVANLDPQIVRAWRNDFPALQDIHSEFLRRPGGDVTGVGPHPDC